MSKHPIKGPPWKGRWRIEESAGVEFSAAFKKSWRKGDLFRHLCKRSSFEEEMDRDFGNFMTIESSFMSFESTQWLEDSDLFNVYLAFMYGACLFYSVGNKRADKFASRAIVIEWRFALSRAQVR